MNSRRKIEMALGALWLLDGLLQLQPHMFSPDFGHDLFGMASMGLPGPLRDIDSSLAGLVRAHPAVWNSGFAVTQLALGAGLLWRRTARVALPASIAWALAVWVVGEGVGGLFMSGISVVNGAPGAALLYAVIALLCLPERGPGDGAHPRLSGAGPLLWAAFWWGTGLLELRAANHASALPGAELGGVGVGEPHFVSAVNSAVGRLVTGHGLAFALAVGGAHLAVGGLVLSRPLRTAGLAAGAILGVLYGVLGQDLGGLLTGQATDPGSGPLIVLFALALWPRSPARAPGLDPVPAGDGAGSVREVAPAAAPAY